MKDEGRRKYVLEYDRPITRERRSYPTLFCRIACCLTKHNKERQKLSYLHVSFYVLYYVKSVQAEVFSTLTLDPSCPQTSEANNERERNQGRGKGYEHRVADGT